MNSEKGLSRRRFLCTIASSTAASLVAPPALSFALGNPRTFSGARMSSVEAGSGEASQLRWQDQGVLNLANSPYAKLHSVPVCAVTIEEGFWSKRRKTNVERSIPTMRVAT